MKTILIGLDGATYSILDRFMGEGIMPHLAELARRGARGELLSTTLPLTPPAWTSMITGRTPGYHGVLDFVQPVRRGEGIYVRLVDARDICCETVWSYAGRNDRRVISLNFPVMFPPKPVNGSLVAGLVSSRHIRRAVYPPELYERLKRLPAFDPAGLGWDMEREEKCVQGLPPGEFEDWIQFHIRREEQWFEIFRYLMHNDPADLCAVLFDGVDKLQHLCWPWLESKSDAQGGSPWDARIRSLCREYFKRLDALIGQIVEMGGKDATVFVASDHGFGPNEKVFHVNVWLQQHGYLEWAETPASDSGAMFHARRNTRLFDWNKTQAYAVSASSNGIYIPVCAAPGQPGVALAEYESFRSRLISELLEFRDPESGEPVVRRAMTREEAFPGPYGERAPDLTLELEDYGFVSVANASEPLKRRQVAKGMHRPEGVIMAAGPGIRRGKTIRQLSIVDVCPALLYTLGLDIPEDLEGRLPVELFERARLRARPPRWGKPTTVGEEQQPQGPDLSQDEEAAVLAGLRALGYLE